MSYGILAKKPHLYKMWPYAVDFQRTVPPTRREEYAFARQEVERTGKRIILDAACGWDPHWHILPELLADRTHSGTGAQLPPFYTIIAMDANPEVLYNFKPVDGIIRMLGDICGMPFADQQYDCTLCISTLEHLPNSYQSRALQELARVTRHTLILTADGVDPNSMADFASKFSFDPGKRIDQPGEPLRTEKGVHVSYLVAKRTHG